VGILHNPVGGVVSLEDKVVDQQSLVAHAGVEVRSLTRGACKSHKNFH
jgi:hypothetical protein